MIEETTTFPLFKREREGDGNNRQLTYIGQLLGGVSVSSDNFFTFQVSIFFSISASIVLNSVRLWAKHERDRTSDRILEMNELVVKVTKH